MEKLRIKKETSKFRACKGCGRLKSFEEFVADGCENCLELQFDGNPEEVNLNTTRNYSGMVALFKPEKSQIAKLFEIKTQKSGLYAALLKD